MFVPVALTGCKDEHYFEAKTPGEVTGEKIQELLDSGKYMSRCCMHTVFVGVRNFSVDGQFMYIYGITMKEH